MTPRPSGGDAGEVLSGNVGGALRIGDTVHRATGPWTPAVHALLAHLEHRLAHLPRVLGFDDQGREVLTFLPGTVGGGDTPLTREQLRSAVAWTREFHLAVAGFSHPGPWRTFGLPDPTIIGHNDIGYYNLCFDGDELVGVFDWDLAGPTNPLMELAFIAWNGVPLWRDTGPEQAVDRLRVIASGYGGFTPRQILEAVPVRIRAQLNWVVQAAAAGDPGMINLMSLGEPARSIGPLTDLEARIPRIAALLD